MKNTQIFPFERNKYYYGMLLSVENFNTEQKYMNDKRRLINRLLFGSGIVSGMNVVRVDDKTISLESGLAIDHTGREIVVASPVTKKLSMLNGYHSAMSSGNNTYVYLCIEYSEDEHGQGYDLASGSGKNIPDRIKEGYELYLTSAEPDDNINPVNSLLEQSVTVYSDQNMCIRHVIPRFVNPMSEFEFRVEIETFTNQFVSFSYDLQLVCMTGTADESSVLNVKFNEMLGQKTGKYTLRYRLRANNVSDTKATAAVDPSTFSITYDKQPSGGSVHGQSETSVISGSITDALFKSYYDTDMDTKLRSSLGNRLYLARIDLLNAEETSVIEKICCVPFGQYVINNDLQNALLRNLRFSPSEECSQTTASGKTGTPARASDTNVTSGICRVDLSSGSLKNKVYYSEEIIHGLGLGSVTLVLGLKTKNGGTIYGSSEIFKNETPQIKLAARLDPAKGSFVIGVMTTATVLDDFVEVKWTAIRDVDEAENDRNEMKILIRPSSLVLKPGESKYLDAVCLNMANKTLRWSVSPENGGNIDNNGLYTAPVSEGVYEVIARSAVYPNIKASIMAVVRN